MARNIALDGATVYKVIVTTTFADDYPERNWGPPLRLAGTTRIQAYGPYLKATTAKVWGSTEVGRLTAHGRVAGVTATYEVVPGTVTWDPISG